MNLYSHQDQFFASTVSWDYFLLCAHAEDADYRVLNVFMIERIFYSTFLPFVCLFVYGLNVTQIQLIDKE